MTPADVKAIRILAEYFGLDGVGYNPSANDAQANQLVQHFGLTVKRWIKGPWNGYAAFMGDDRLAAMGGYGEDHSHRRYVIVHAAAEIVKPDWRQSFICFKEGLDPFEIGHIVDARR